MRKNCLKCQNLAYWDDDWCCTAHFTILSGIADGKATEPENLTKDRGDCEEWKEETNEKIIDLRKDI